MNANDEKEKDMNEKAALFGETFPQAKDGTATEGRRRKAILLSLGRGVLYGLFGYWMESVSLPFGVAPFGIAMLCATDRGVLYTYAGLCISALFGQSRALLLGVYTAILLVRLLTRFVLDPPWSREQGEAAGELTVSQIWPYLFCEQIGLRMATSAIAAFGVGLYRLILGGFLYYDLYGTILATIVAPVAVLLFTGYWSRGNRGGERQLSGLLSIAFILIRGTVDSKLYGISLGMFGAMLLTLYLTRRRGMTVGVISGVTCGLAVSVSLSPAFAFGAIVAGLLFSFSPLFAATAAMSVGIAWGAYVSGIGVLNGLLPSLFAASMLFVAADKLFLRKEGSATTETEEKISPNEKAPFCRPLVALERNGILLMEREQQLRFLEESFSALSEVFSDLSRRMQTPAAADLRQICDNAFDGSCASCSERGYCWGERYHETSGEVGRLCTALHQNGHVERADAGESLLARCGRLPDVLEEINHNTARHRREIHEGDRTEIFAMDYRGIAELLRATLERGENEFSESETLTKVLSELGLDLTGVCVLDGDRRRVAVCGGDRETLVREELRIRDAIEKSCSFPVEEGVLAEKAAAVMFFFERERLCVSVARHSLCAEGEETYCGDSVGTFRSQNGRFYGFISDGMGAGREAAITSGLCGVFLQKMLGAGNSCDTALHMLNGFLRNRGSGSLHECSATVDLMELDLLNGRAYFYKSGAAPTYVYRNGSLLKLRSHTVPVGIIRELDTRRIEFEVSEGDLIVMVSDGVTQGREECPWLFDLLRSQAPQEDTEALADRIARYAKSEGSPDDISVLAIRIREK